MEKLRCAVIGSGKVGHFHAKAFNELESTVLVACFSRRDTTVKPFAEKYNINGYTDVVQMFEKENLDVISICTPHPNHAEYAVLAASYGVHVAIEKPLAISLSDCNDIINAKNQYSVKMTTIVQRRFFKPCMRIKNAINDGKIGTPILSTVNMYGWRDQDYYDSDPWRGSWDGEGGGVLVNQAPHQLDLMLWYMGDIQEVYGDWKNYNHPYIEVEDTAVAMVKFKNGAMGSIVVSNSQNPALYGKVHVFGSNGASLGVQTDGGEMFVAGMSKINEPPLNDIWKIPGEETKLEKYRKNDTQFFNSIDATTYFHIEQIKDFIDAIINNHEPLVSVEDGRKTVELFTAIYRSSRTGLPVKFPIKM